MRSLITMMTVLLLLAANAVYSTAERAGDPVAGTLEPAAGRFLVATRGLHGPYFSRSVVYLIQHNSEGTVGVIVNRPLGKKVVDVLPDTRANVLGSYPVYIGGPVSPSVMVMLFRDAYQTGSALHVSGDVYASSSSSVLAQLMTVDKPVNELRMFAGQAGWAPGQLARELERDSWYVTAGDPDALFSNDTGGLWRKLIDRLDPQGIMVLEQPGPIPADDYSGLS